MIKFETGGTEPCSVRIKVIGVGGGGTNAVNRMIQTEVPNVSFATINTDVQGLSMALSKERVQIGKELTGGLGSGASPQVGHEAAMQSLQTIAEAIEETDILFLTAGFGGGTGTGATPIVAQIAREMDIMCIAVVTTPFSFEGKKRMVNAEEGFEELKQHVNTMICIPNDKVLDMISEETPFTEAFKVTDDIIASTVRNLTRIITEPGLVNLDFADLRTIMNIRGESILSFGVGRGKNKAMNAVDATLSSVLVEEKTIRGAKGLLLSITGGEDMTLFEVNNAVKKITKMVNPEANIIFGAMIDKKIKDSMHISMIATGIDPTAIQIEKMDMEFTPVPESVDRGISDTLFKDEESLFNQKPKTGEDYEVPAFVRRKKLLPGLPLYSNEG